MKLLDLSVLVMLCVIHWCLCEGRSNLTETGEVSDPLGISVASAGEAIGDRRRKAQNGSGTVSSKFKVLYEWKKMDYQYLLSDKEDVPNEEYDPKKIIPIDVDVWEKDGRRKVFVTTPRRQGVPATLSTLRETGVSNAPPLAPYPDWTWHQKGDCDGISSVYRVAVDELDRLWVMDRGDGEICEPQLLTFDLHTDALQSRYRFPESVLAPKHNLINPVVDVREGGKNTFVYIADEAGHALYVYDHQAKRSWRIEHPAFGPDLSYAEYDIAGTSFRMTDGVFGVALGPVVKGDRTLYFHPLASVSEHWVRTSVLRDPANFRNGAKGVSKSFKKSTQNRPSQSAAEAMTSEGVLFSGLLSDLAIACWDSKTPFAGWNLHIVGRDPDTLQFPSGMKVRGTRLWVLTNRYQRFATHSMDWNDVNFRVLTARVDDLVKGTPCDVGRETHS